MSLITRDKSLDAIKRLLVTDGCRKPSVVLDLGVEFLAFLTHGEFRILRVRYMPLLRRRMSDEFVHLR